MRVCVCVSERECVCASVFMCVFGCACVCMRLWLCMCACVCVRLYARVRVCECACVRVCMCVRLRVYACVLVEGERKQERENILCVTCAYQLWVISHKWMCHITTHMNGSHHRCEDVKCHKHECFKSRVWMHHWTRVGPGALMIVSLHMWMCVVMCALTRIIVTYLCVCM